METSEHPVLVVQPRNRPPSSLESCQQSLYGRLLLQFLIFRNNQRQLEELATTNQFLRQRLQAADQSLSSSQQPISHPTKHHIRRPFNQIEKNYLCEEGGCSKRYASKASLKLHTKIKHNKENVPAMGGNTLE